MFEDMISCYEGEDGQIYLLTSPAVVVKATLDLFKLFQKVNENKDLLNE